MTVQEVHSTVTEIAAALERMSSRLRKVEVLSRTALASAASFLTLPDTPNSYIGYAGNTVIVNIDEDGVQFSPFSSACVTLECGPIGWRATGGTAPRTLAHENGFQLSSSGDDRGAYAIDFQQLRYYSTQVAGAEMSAIYSNEENIIDPDCDWSTIVGPYNDILDNSFGCHIIGAFHTIDISSYGLVTMGSTSILEDVSWGFFAYDDNDSFGALGIFALGEGNILDSTVHDYPTYTGTMGIVNIQEGDVWYGFQFGEANKYYAFGEPGSQCWIGVQVGLYNYSENVNLNFLFGENLKSREALGENFYDGRMLLGESGAFSPDDGTGYWGGFQQSSWFSQDEMITTWPVAWTTSRFEFPVIQESAWGFTAYISVTNQFCTNIGCWKIEGIIKNAGGVTSLPWTAVTVLYRDTATKNWQAIPDNVNDRLVFQFQDTAGPDVTNYNIQIRMDTEEVGYD